MKLLIFILLIINFLNFIKCDEKNNIKCFEGEGISQRNWDKINCETAQWCIKLSDDGNVNEYRQCDEGNNICKQIGNKCDNNNPDIVIEHHHVTFPVDSICCCNTGDYCNSAIIHYTKFILILQILLIYYFLL